MRLVSCALIQENQGEHPCLLQLRSSPPPPFGYPRIGRQRQLKRALEAYWAGRSSETELLEAASKLRQENLARLVELGLGASDASLADAPSFYDQVLDATVLLGAIPPRFAGREGLDLYFALARGDEKVGPEEMTKWFDTNYHYLVPEIGPDTPLRLPTTPSPVSSCRPVSGAT